VADDELLEMLAAEAKRRTPPVKKSLKKLAKASKPDPDAVEELRVEVHGLKGAALVLGQNHLGRLADRAEQLLAAAARDGTVDPELAAKLSEAMDAFEAGAAAASRGEPEPASVPDSLVALS
jgi:chemotaxis protein histidine kinase CheA